jgi:phosphatidylinositol-3-phosphatase
VASLLAVGVVLVAVAAGNGHPVLSTPCGAERRPPAGWKHVVWIWMENASYEQIVGSPSAPYLNELEKKCGLATSYHAITHPSLPNYLAATSGSTWGVTDDAPPSAHPLTAESIFGQIAADGMTWRSYEESMPANCDLSSSGEYAVKHNPAAYYLRLRHQCARWNVPLPHSRLDGLPSFSFVTPNLCDDMHDCSIATGDAWLRQWVGRILASREYVSGTTVLFITFDEGSGSSNRVATVVVSPTTPRGARANSMFNHYSLLKTTEQLLGISSYLGHASDRSTTSMRSAFRI